MATVQLPIAPALPNPTPDTLGSIGNQSAAPGNTAQTQRSLYVGDLHPDVTEALLFEKFSKVGTVTSIRICRDAITRRSLGYAYVNFQRHEDAEHAIESMNFELLNNRPIRIMWSQRDPSLRRSTAGNIFIKNLDKRIDVKSLFDTFTLFGKILSCKIAMDDEGNSKGYGFIHFETEEAAQVAISKVNGMLLDEKKVHVVKFVPRAQRLREFGDSAHRFTNVYIKNFADLLDDEKLKELFSKFGTITSAVVMKDADGKSRGFGFVAFEEHEQAAKAVEEMNDYELPEADKKLIVCRAQKKAERQAELKRRYALWKSELEKKCKGSNLYVKNLEESVDDEKLHAIFEEFGKITSARVMRDENGRSRCFGFVCFENAESALKAKEEKHNKIQESKPLYVALAQRKGDRQAFLASRFMRQMNQMRMQGQPMPGAVYTPAGGYFVAPSVQGQAFMASSVPAQMRGAAPRWNQMTGYVMPNQTFQMRGNNRTLSKRPQNHGPSNGRGVGTQTQHHLQNKPAQVVYPYQAVIAQQSQQIPIPTAQPAFVNQPAPLNPQDTTVAQKQMIGEKIYTRIGQMWPNEDASKITGMLLEMEMGELVRLLEDESLLKAKASEAVTVLHEAAKTQQA